MAIAQALARSGKSVLLVDADLRRPSVARRLGLPNEVGLTDVLTGQAPLAEALSPGPDRVSVLTSGPLPPSPADLLDPTRISEVLLEAEEFFDCVIIDGPPVLGLADAPLLSAAAAATIFILQAGRNHHGRAKAALRRLRQAGTSVLGIVLTKLDPKAAGSSEYYDVSSYYYGHEESATRERV
jgi:capsular exopolysaccharide synthesis family protein